MASFLGTEYSSTQPTSNVNVGLVNAVLQAKQQRYDVAKTQIQQTIDSFGSLDVIRPQDQEYLAAKITDVVGKINAYGNRDLSQGNAAADILGAVKTVANDPNVLNAVASTQVIRKFDAQVQQIKEKHPEFYNDRNYSFALANGGANDYMNGKTNTIGDLRYNNFSDYNKKFNDLLTDLESKRKDQTVQVQEKDPITGAFTGRMIETTISGLSPEQIKSIAQSSLDQNDQKQIEIDGWYNAGGYNNPEISKVAEVKVNTDIENYNSKIDELNLKKKQGGSPNEIAKWDSQLAILTSNKTTLQKNLEVYTKNPKIAATYIQQEKTLDDFVNRFKPFYVESQKIVKDESYWAQKNYDLNLAKFKYQQQTDALDPKKDLSGGQGLLVTSAGLAPESEIDSAEQEVNNQISTIGGQLNTTLLQYKSVIEAKAASGDSDAKSLLNIYNNKLKTKKEGQSDIDIFRATVTETDSTNDNLAIIGGKNYKADIRKYVDDFDFYTSAKNAVTDESRIAHIDATLNNDKTFKAFYDNPNTKMIWSREGVVKAVPVKDVLIATGLMDSKGNKIGDIKSKPQVLQYLERSYYADDILSNLSLPSGTGENKKTVTRADSSLIKLANSFGENPKDVFTKSEAGGGGDMLGKGFENFTINPNSKTGKYIEQAKKNKLYDTFDFADQSLSSDDSTIGAFVRDDYKQSDSYKKSLEDLRAKLPNNQVVGVAPAQEALYNRLSAIASSIKSNFKPPKDSTINVRDAGDSVEVSATNFTTKGGVNIPNSDSVLISKKEFQYNFPELSARIGFNSQSAVYTAAALKDKPLISPRVQYIKDTASDNYEWASEVLLKDKPQLVGYLSDTDSRTTLQTANSILIKQHPEVKTVINEAINKSSDFGVNISLSDKYGNPKLYIKLLDRNSGEVVHSVKLDNYKEADAFKEVLDNAPQVYYSMLINDILQKQQSSQITGNSYPAYDKLKQFLKVQ